MVLGIASCKSEGEIGPQGPKGEQGFQGEEGEQGLPGTANVMYSKWTNFNTSNWKKVTEFGRETQLYEINEDSIKDNILNTGVVMVYIKFGGAPAPRPLPFTGYVTSNSKEQHIWFRLLLGKIVIAFHNLNDQSDPGTFGPSNQYRYVIIPGSVFISSNAKVANIKTLSYKELCQRYNIPMD